LAIVGVVNIRDHQYTVGLGVEYSCTKPPPQDHRKPAIAPIRRFPLCDGAGLYAWFTVSLLLRHAPEVAAPGTQDALGA